MYGPTLPISQEQHAKKYREPNETYGQLAERLSLALSDNDEHKKQLEEIILEMRFLFGGRVQKDIGSPFSTTAFNCFVSGTIHDDIDSIMDMLKEAAQTLRRGGGIGYDFSRLRPNGDYIRTLSSQSSGPCSFMDMYDSMCGTIRSAGHRRGAQMGVLRIDHPDIIEFITKKDDPTKWTNFNVSVAVTERFMQALEAGEEYDLKFNGKHYRKERAQDIWELIMEHTWRTAEPGVMWIDRINEMNPLNYCERIATTNPCGEVPLPSYGACLLGSFNLTKYLTDPMLCLDKRVGFNFDRFKRDIVCVHRAMDNVIDRTQYPLRQQEADEKNKRRIGIGITGLANTLEVLGFSYGSQEFVMFTEAIMECLRDTVLQSSMSLAVEKGTFPMFNTAGWLDSGYAKTLPDRIRDGVVKYGLRNGCHFAIAPTGTISLCADNISSGIEPPFLLEYKRLVSDSNGSNNYKFSDWAYREHGISGKTADQCSVDNHLNVLCAVQKYVDHAVSKTCNVGSDVSYDDFKDIYLKAYKQGAKGVTTFRENGEREGILKSCDVDPETGLASCDL